MLGNHKTVLVKDAAMIKGQSIICISTSDWDKPWGSRQQIMLQLFQENRILFIEYQMSILHPFRYPFLWRKYKNWKKGIRKIKDRLYIYSPFPNLPFGTYFGIINRINQYLLQLVIKKISKKLNLKNPILWLYVPSSVNLVGKLREKMVIYHCIDDFVSEKKNFFRQKTMMLYEEQLVKKADIVFASTQNLYRRHKAINSNTTLLTSAVDEEFLKSAAIEEVREKVPKDIMNIPNPRIGTVGIFNERIDIELMEYILTIQPNWSIVFIGPVFLKKIFELYKYRNVYFLGMKSRNEIPYYIQALDVCLIPYKVNNFTKAISPLKLFEYLSLGKSIVATALPDLDAYKELIDIALNKKEFIKNIEKNLTENKNENLIKRRIEVARSNTWKNRVLMISEIICNYLNSI